MQKAGLECRRWLLGKRSGCCGGSLLSCSRWRCSLVVVGSGRRDSSKRRRRGKQRNNRQQPRTSSIAQSCHRPTGKDLCRSRRMRSIQFVREIRSKYAHDGNKANRSQKTGLRRGPADFSPPRPNQPGKSGDNGDNNHCIELMEQFAEGRIAVPTCTKQIADIGQYKTPRP